jgi:hypothetical protein
MPSVSQLLSLTYFQNQGKLPHVDVISGDGAKKSSIALYQL